MLLYSEELICIDWKDIIPLKFLELFTGNFFIPCPLLPPANEVCEGYVFTPVSQSFCSQRGGSPGPYPGGAVGGQAWGSQAHTRGVPRPTPWGGPGSHLEGVCPSMHWGRHPPTSPPQQTATAAGRTHPTGMHSFFFRITDRMGSSPILYFINTIIIGIMVNNNSGTNWHGLRNVTCKQTLNMVLVPPEALLITSHARRNFCQSFTKSRNRVINCA